MTDIVEEMRLDAKAFRENTVYTSDGDPVRLSANADRMDAAADEIQRLRAYCEAMAGAFGEISDLHGEINPSNYDHDDACELNRQFVYALTIAAEAPAAYRADYPEKK